MERVVRPRRQFVGQKRYTDPDPNVQFELMRQENWRKGGWGAGSE
jgi:hypothetical protein